MKRLLEFVRKGNLYTVTIVSYAFGIAVFMAWTFVTFLVPVPDKLKVFLFGVGVIVMLFFFGLNGIVIILRREIPYVIPATIKGHPAMLFGYFVLVVNWSLMGYLLIGLFRYGLRTGLF